MEIIKNLHFRKSLWVWSIALVFLTGVTIPGGEIRLQVGNDEPAGLFLTWQQDPTTTMTIDWHTIPDHEAVSVLYYREMGTDDWNSVSASQHSFPFSDRTIHRVELTELEQGSYYQFRTGEFERVYKFRTMPQKNDRPVRFAAGGDTSYGDRFKEINLTALEFDIDFIAWGGDLAYADAREDRLYRWENWFKEIKETLISDNGRIVPIVLAIGNHEMVDHHYPVSDLTLEEEERMIEFIEQVQKGEYPESTEEWREENAPYFYGLFAFPGQPGYGVLDFGDYLSLISLDSSHSNLISGKQTDWLEEVLKKRTGRPHLIPFYHKHAYPSQRVQPGGRPNQIWSEQVLRYWVPLFEKYGVRVALENDDHTYKRTYPIFGDRYDPSGIVYIGDGAWGVGAREPLTPEEVWYLKRTASENHFIIVTLHGPHQHFLMVNQDKEIIDEYPETPRW